MTKDVREIEAKKRLVGKLLTNLTNDVSNSNLDEDELDVAVDALTQLNIGIVRVSKATVCDEILHCSGTTFDNYVKAEIIPPGRKEVGFKELSWRRSDFTGIKLKRIHASKIK